MEFSNFLNPETLETIKSGGYFVTFGLMILEWPFVTMAAAFLASIGFFNIFLIAFLWWMGDTIGDIILFLIGRFGLRFFAEKRVMDTEKKENLLEKIDILIEKNFWLSLIFIKFTPYAPMIVLPYLGASRKIPMLKFVTATAILSLPVPILVALIGYHLNTIQLIAEKIPENFRIITLILLILSLILLIFFIFFLVKKYKKLFLEKIESYIKNSKKNTI